MSDSYIHIKVNNLAKKWFNCATYLFTISILIFCMKAGLLFREFLRTNPIYIEPQLLFKGWMD